MQPFKVVVLVSDGEHRPVDVEEIQNALFLVIKDSSDSVVKVLCHLSSPLFSPFPNSFLSPSQSQPSFSLNKQKVNTSTSPSTGKIIFETTIENSGQYQGMVKFYKDDVIKTGWVPFRVADSIGSFFRSFFK